MTFLTGFLMAIADSVPGVSGGTIAYILKRYELLFFHINCLLKRDFNKESITFLVKLALGWITGFVSAIFVITSIFESHIYQISSLFLGFILVSIFIVIKQEREFLHAKNLIFTLLGFAAVIVLVLFQNSGLITLSADNLTIGSYVYIFIVGAMAICAMLLPGVSGSSVMMIFGVYFLIIESVHSFLTLDFSVLPILLSLGFGILFGAIGAVKVITHLFATKRSQIIHVILGLLIGSIGAIIYGPTTIEGQNLQILNFETFSLVFFLIGVVIIGSLEYSMSKSSVETSPQTK